MHVVSPWDRLGWIFTAPSFPECLLVIYLTYTSFTFPYRDQAFCERLRSSDN